MGGGGQESNTQRVTIFFRLGTSQAQMADLASESKLKVRDLKIPEFYTIGIITTELPSKTFSEKLKKQAAIIQAISADSYQSSWF